MYDIIIVGAGPAGLTSALYALRARKKVLILEANTCGGQIVSAHRVENYPGIESISGADFAKQLYQQVKKLGAEIKYETAIHVSEDKVVTTNEGEYQGRSVILATGAKNRKLNIENEQEFVGKGVSYCATCDGGFYKNKVVAVNGGGNTALEDALYLADIAKKVYLIHRRDTFRGEEKYAHELREKENVTFILNATVTAINGKEQLESITIQQKEEEKELKIDGLFIAIGQEPKNEMFANVVEINESGYIVSPDGVHTKVDGIYVAGDSQVKVLRQLTTAVSDGSVAATIAIKEMAEQAKELEENEKKNPKK